jgi:hypothetical protein
MGLDKFKKESDEQEPEIKTRKQIQNVTMDEWFWTNIICTAPEWAAQAAVTADGNGDKAIIQRMDEILEDGAKGHELSPAKRQEIKNERDRYVEEHLKEEADDGA